MKAKLFRAVPFARTGVQEYASHEIGGNGNGLVMVDRPTVEVARSAPTFEGVPLTMDHPSDLLDSRSVDRAAVGIVSSVTFNGRQVRGDLLVWDEVAIKAIKRGRRELSAGYMAEYQRDGVRFTQRAIRGNHVALVARGRSGAAQKIGG